MKGSFASELKRRKVLRVAGPYFVTGVMVLEAADQVLPTLFVPAWVQQALVAVVIAGFPVALVLAWLFRITDGRIRRERPPEAEPTAKAGIVQRAAVPILIALVILLIWRPWSAADPLAALAGGGFTDSVAVLPVENRTGDPANDHVAVAITEGVVQYLQGTGRIKVSDPFSVSDLVDAGVVASDLAEVLGVEKLIRGSLYLEGDRLELNATTIDPADNRVIWSRPFSGGEASGHEAAVMIATAVGI